MHVKRTIPTLVAAAIFATAPALAGSFGVYGSYWDADQADKSSGGGARVGFNLVKYLELDFHGTDYPSFNTDINGQNVDLTAKPVDATLRVNFLPSGPITPYVGAGVTYYFLSADGGSVDNKTGILGQAGLEMGGKGARFFVEALWRKMDAKITLASFDRNTQFDGVAANAGVVWRWGN